MRQKLRPNSLLEGIKATAHNSKVGCGEEQTASITISQTMRFLTSSHPALL